MMHSTTRAIVNVSSSPAGSPTDRFVAAWEMQSAPPDLHEFVHNHPDLSDRDLTDVVLADLMFRWRSGACPAAEEYLRAWPQIARIAELKLDLVYGEYRARLRRGTQADPEEFCERFPELAGELRLQLQMAECMRVFKMSSERIETQKGAKSSVDEIDARAPLSLDDYELGEMLGSGAMGEIYRAEQKSLARQVAIKFLKCQDEDDKRGVERFLREAQMTARLQHPNIVDVRGIGRCPEGRYFLVMDLIDGVSLEQRLQQGPLAIAEAVEILGRVADAVEHAHTRGVIHRDLKPANILIDREGQVRVTDFGLAKSYDASDPALSVPGHIIGTPHHMAPEQVDRRLGDVGPATDVYGLGSLLYTLMTGGPPYVGETVLEVLMQVTSAVSVVAPSTIRPEVPRSIESVCLKCLNRSPNDRFGSAAEVREALLRAGDTVRTSQPTVVLRKPEDRLENDFPAHTPEAPSRGGARAGHPVSCLSVAPRKLAAARPRIAVGAVVGSLVLAMLVFALWLSADSGPHMSLRAGTSPAATPAVRVDWSVDIFPGGQFDQRVPLAGHARALSSDDMIRLRLDFSQPVYAYVFWIGSEGSLQCLHPEVGQQQRMVAGLDIPGHRGKAMPIEGPAGMELCAVFLRDSVLENPIASFQPWTPDSTILQQNLEVALLDGYPLRRQPSADGRLESVERELAGALAKLPAGGNSRSLGEERFLEGVSVAESLLHWLDGLPEDLGAVYWLAVPHH